MIGGGSGHYPAFGGLVGPGLAHGAAMGNLFASPSAQQVYAVAKAADNGGGVLFSYGNYAGDVLHFDAGAGAAARRGHRLPQHRDGHRRHLQRPADREAQAPRHRRRPDRVQDRRRRRGGRLPTSTRSRGSPSAPTTAPGRSASRSPAARCPAPTSRCSPCPKAGWRSGLGIHGEPGIDETDIPTADGLAELLVAKLLAEVPEGRRGPAGPASSPSSTAWAASSTRSCSSSTGASPSCSPTPASSSWTRRSARLVTSFDMAGTSLTLFWLDDELETLWHAPADTPAFRRGPSHRRSALDAAAAADASPTPIAARRPRQSRPPAPTVLAAVRTVARDRRRPRRRARPDRRHRRRRRPRHRHAARRPTPPSRPPRTPSTRGAGAAHDPRTWRPTPGPTRPAAPPAPCGASS